MKAYLILYNNHIDDGFIETAGTTEESIKTIIREDKDLLTGKGIRKVSVDLENLKAIYYYQSYDNTMESKELSLIIIKVK